MSLKVNPVGKVSVKMPDGSIMRFAANGKIDIHRIIESTPFRNIETGADINIDLEMVGDSFEVVEIRKPGESSFVQVGQIYAPGWKVSSITKFISHRAGTEVEYIVKRDSEV